MQALLLPVVAIAFAASPVAAQNFGAGDHDHVGATFRFAALLSSALMIAMSLLAHWSGLRLHHVWWLSVATVILQTLLSLWLLRREFARKLTPRGAHGLSQPA